jgi:hypothetical protein
MKFQFTYFIVSILLCCSTSLYSAKPISKNIYDKNVVNDAGEKINYSKAELQAQKVAQKSPTVKQAVVNDLTTVTKTPFNGQIDNLYSIMGTSIGRNSMHSMDIDKDGSMEIICSATNQGFGVGNFWYIMRYDPTDKVWNQVWTSPQYTVSINCLEIVDLNNDGNYEVLLGLSNGSIEIYNGATRDLIKSVSCVTEGINSITFADADNDSMNDIVISGSQNTYILNASTLAVKYTINKGANYVRVGVLDNTNKNEIVLSSGYIYKLLGTTLTTEWNYNTSSDGYVELSDIDNDTKKEVVFAQSWNYIYVYDVDTKTTKYSIKTDLDINSLCLTDVNNDGVDEILYGDGQWGKVFCYNSVTQAKMWSVANPEHGVCALNYADVNNDGVKELIWTAGWTSTGSDYMYIYNVTDSKLLWRSDDIVGPMYAVASGDVDDDGKQEIVAVSNESESGYDSGIIFIIDAQTNKLKWKCSGTFLNGCWTGVYDISVSDIDNDGKNEIVIGAGQTYTGEIWIIDGKTHTIKSNHIFSTENISEFYSLTIDDIDNDGKKEVIALNRSNLYVINPTDWSIKWSVAVSSSYTNAVIKSADINGDGNKEIVVCKGNLQIVNTSDHSVWTATDTNFSNFDTFDYNNDGIIDIVASTSTGHITVIDGKTKATIRDIAPETTPISAVRVFKSNSTIFFVYSCGGKINIYQNDTNCSVSKYLGANAGDVESLKFYNSQASSTEILVGTSISVLKMYWNVLTTSTNSLTIATEENSKVSFSVNTLKNWTVTSDQSWLSLNTTTGTGNSTLIVTAAANPRAEKRSAILTVTDSGSNPQLVTVTQDGATPVLTTSQSSTTIGALSGSTNSLNISSNLNWTAGSNQSWLTLSSSTGSGNATLNLTAASNPTIGTRTAIITLTGTGITAQTVTVIQDAGAAILTTSVNNLTIAAALNSTKTISVYSNVNWTATSDQTWLKVSPASATNSTSTLTTVAFTAQENPTTNTRTANVTISGAGAISQIVTITQNGQVPAMVVSSNSLSIGAYANSTQTLTIASNINWTASCNQDWLSLSNYTGSNNSTITLTAQNNPTVANRTATITISGNSVQTQTIIVTQTEGAAVLAVSTSFITINDQNPQISFDVVSNTSWVVSSNQTWLLTNIITGTGNSKISFNAEKNNTSAARAASIIVSGTGFTPQAITVIQDVTSGFSNIQDNLINLYPNPVMNDLFVNNLTTNTKIFVYDLNGVLMTTKMSESAQVKIDVSSFPKGVYTVRISDKLVTRFAKFIKI